MTDDASRLRRAAYEGLVFPVTDAPFEVGNDLVEHTADQVPGADLEPTGRTAFRGTLTIPFLTTVSGYGELYPAGWQTLLSLLQTTPKGQLTHPVLGTFRAGLKTLKSPFGAKVKNGVIVELEWIEDRASIRATPADSELTTSPDGALASADDADTALASVGVSPRVGTAARTAAAKLVSAQPYAVTASVFDDLDGQIAAALELDALRSPTLATALSAHQAVAALERARTSALRWRALVLPRRARTFRVPRAMAVWEVALQVYGDVGRAGALRASNGLTTGIVRAGTTLVIP